MEFGDVGFYGGKKTRVPGEKPSEQGRKPTTNVTHIWREKNQYPEKNPRNKDENQHQTQPTYGTNNKLNPHMTPGLGIEPGPHWWKASALTTAPSLLPAAGVQCYHFYVQQMFSVFVILVSPTTSTAIQNKNKGYLN